MKTHFLILSHLRSLHEGFCVFAQETSLKQNELKINMSNLIGFKWLDFGYERILNEESSIGVGDSSSAQNTQPERLIVNSSKTAAPAYVRRLIEAA